MSNPKVQYSNDAAVTKKLANAIKHSTKSAKFCVAGFLPVVNPGLEVEGLGVLKFPLKRTKAKELVAHCQDSPYGKGTQTLIDKQVRDTYELDPKKFRVSDAWNAAIDDVMSSVAEQLGLPEQLDAKLYKLLVYERGGFFLPHRDSEKHDRMVASMIVVLPSPFEGGELVVRHGPVKQELAFEEAAAGKMPCYAAFYADCEHEVERVTSGVRVCLAYNLVLKKPQRGRPATAAKPSAPVDTLADSIGVWVAKEPTKPLFFALDHHYTQRGLSLELFKGSDRQLADLVVAAAGKAECMVTLAQVERHLTQFADDGSFADSFSRYSRTPRRRSELQIGETYEDELIGKEWTDINGKKQAWGTIAFDLSAIVSSEPINDWKPTTEEYEGYTGNAGNTLDRWYHRSAIVVWHRDHHFDVVASSGAAVSIPLFSSMTAKLAKTPKKRLEAARSDCIRFARAIVAQWSRQSVRYRFASVEEKPTDDQFPKCLLALRDRDTIAQFLAKMAERDQIQPLSSLILTACREFGWSAFAQELISLISSQPTDQYGRREEDVPVRDIEWLSAFCCDQTVDPDKSMLAQKLCTLAVARFCAPRPQHSSNYYYHHRREHSHADKALTQLLQALLAVGFDDDLARVIRFVQQSPDRFNRDDYQVPCLKSLVSWSLKRFGTVHPHVAAWLASVRQQLESATAKRPVPPADWARPAEVTCSCKHCAQLNAFLADPANEVGRIPASESMRQHLNDKMRQHQCDAHSTLERKGSPYSLVLTKTNGSFDRAVKRYETDLRLLGELPSVS